MHTGLIYKFTNKENGKVYIGQTIRQLKIRIKEHFQSKGEANSYFHNALRKYGFDKFELDVIETDIPENILEIREIYWILYYQSYKRHLGYNRLIGGISGLRPYLWKPLYQFDMQGNLLKKWENVQFAAQWLIDNKYTTSSLHNCMNTIRNMAKKLKNRGKSYHGFLWSYEPNAPLYKKEIRDFEGIPVYQYDFKGNIVKIYNEIYQIPEEHPNFKIESILNNCHHNSKSSYGYQWRFENDQTPEVLDKEDGFCDYRHAHSQKAIYVYDLNWTFITEYPSIRHAAKALNIHPVLISNIVNKRFIKGHGVATQSHGYRFEFKISATHY